MGGATPPITDFLFTTFRVQAVSPQPCCHAVSPSPAVSEPRSFSGLWTLHLHLGWTSCCLPPFWWRCGQRTRSLPPRHPWLRWRPCHQHTSLRPSRGHHQSNCQGWVIVFFRLQLAPEQGERRKRLIFPVTWIWGLPGIMFHLLEDQLNPSSYVSCTLRRTSPALIHISWRCSQAYTASCHAATCGCHAVYSSTTCACHDVPCSCHSAISSTTCLPFRSCISSTTCSCHATTCSVGYGFYTAVWSCHARTPPPLSTWSSSGPPLPQPPSLAPQSGSSSAPSPPLALQSAYWSAPSPPLALPSASWSAPSPSLVPELFYNGLWCRRPPGWPLEL